MKLLENKKILVTGGSRGIGRCIVLECLKAGASVAATYHHSKEEMVSLEQEAASYDGNFYYSQMNLEDMDSVSQSISSLIDQLDGIDVLINNAGIIRDRAIPFLDYETWNQVIQTNLTGTYQVIHKVILPMVTNKSGVILNMSSVSGVAGSPGQANYAASKAGILGLTKTLAKELGPYNIRVNAISPGYVNTEMLDKLKEQVRKDALNKIPLNRFAAPEEIAHLAVFLSSDFASYISGQNIIIDGGMC